MLVNLQYIFICLVWLATLYQNSTMAGEVRWTWLFFFIFLNYVLLTFANTPKRRFEYKYSFKPPYLAQRDGTVPFWEYGGGEYQYLFCDTSDTAHLML